MHAFYSEAKSAALIRSSLVLITLLTRKSSSLPPPPPPPPLLIFARYGPPPLPHSSILYQIFFLPDLPNSSRHVKKSNDKIRENITVLEHLERDKEKRARHILATYLKVQKKKAAANAWTQKYFKSLALSERNFCISIYVFVKSSPQKYICPEITAHGGLGL